MKELLIVPSEMDLGSGHVLGAENKSVLDYCVLGKTDLLNYLSTIRAFDRCQLYEIKAARYKNTKIKIVPITCNTLLTQM